MSHGLQNVVSVNVVYTVHIKVRLDYILHRIEYTLTLECSMTNVLTITEEGVSINYF